MSNTLPRWEVIYRPASDATAEPAHFEVEADLIAHAVKTAQMELFLKGGLWQIICIRLIEEASCASS